MEKFRGQILIDFRFSEHLGPRFESAGISLRLCTHDKYEFTSIAEWSSDDCSHAVENGVIDGLRESGYDHNLGISVRLEAVEFHPVDSSEHSFYVAAKCAVVAKAVISREHRSLR